MVWFRRNLLLMPIAALIISAVGCQTHQAALSCGEGCTGAADQDPLIIFMGADRDLGKWGKVPEIAAEFRSCGYNAVYIDPWKQLHDADLLASTIRKAVRCRGRRVMLVGWSQGAVVGLKALEIVAREGICIDTFIELDSFNTNRYMGDSPQPANVRRVVVIRSRMNRQTRGYRPAAVHSLETYWHLGAPTHPHTQNVLLAEARRLQNANSHEVPAMPESGLSKSAPVETPTEVTRTAAATR